MTLENKFIPYFVLPLSSHSVIDCPDFIINFLFCLRLITRPHIGLGLLLEQRMLKMDYVLFI